MADNTHIIREITPLSDKDCFYIAERHKRNLPIRCIAIQNMN